MKKALQLIPNLILGILAILTILGGRPYFFPESLTALYGIDLATLDDITIALLQHRGMMTSTVGFLLIPTIFSEAFGKIAIPLVIFSKATFVIKLFAYSGQVSAVYFDIVAICLLALVYVVRYVGDSVAGIHY